MFADHSAPYGGRFAVIGAGPAGLTYALLVAEGNDVTVFEKDERPGGAFRYAGKAPLFQEVAASEASFDRYIGDLVAACTRKGVKFRFRYDVSNKPEALAPFDRIVIATGARYRFGLGPIATKMLDWGIGRWPLVSRVLSSPRFRDWFYYRARRATADRFRPLVKPGQGVVVIGDAMAAGKSKEAIASAFEAALLQ
jgi:flavin-dependent dehydrogenase